MTNVRLFNEDCIEGMKEVPQQVDLILTDPPFGVAQSKEADKKVKRWRGGKILTSDWDKFESEDAFYSFTEDWMKEAYRILRPKGWFCVWCSWRNIPKFVSIAEGLGLNYKSLFTWAKNNPAISFPVAFTYSCEYVLVFYKTSKDPNFKKYLNNKNITKDYIIQPTISNKEREDAGGHPTPKPINIIKIFINHFTKENDLVLDCFSGSGTTAIVCQETDRNFVGFENNKKYYDKSLLRLKNHKEQGKLRKWF